MDKDFKKILDDIKKNTYAPVYFLMGEEPYFIDKISDLLEKTVVPEEAEGFDKTILYGRDISISDIVGNARRFPLIAQKQLIVVKEAQDLARTIDELEVYLSNIQPSTVLVICYKYKTIDKRKSLYKNLAKNTNVVVYESKKVPEWNLDKWIVEHIAEAGHSIDIKATSMLSEFLGNDLNRIANEVKKLQINIPKGQPITPEDIERNIGVSKDFNNFELQKSIVFKNTEKAYKIAYYFAQNPKDNPLVLTFSTLYAFFSKLLIFHGMVYKNPTVNMAQVAQELKLPNPRFIEDYKVGAKNYPMKKVSSIINILKEFDLKAKGVDTPSTSEYDLLIELLSKIFA